MPGDLPPPLFRPVPPRLPPSNVMAEQAMLGSLLANNQRTADRCEFLRRPEHFADPVNGYIFQRAMERIALGQLADAVTLWSDFENTRVLDEAGGTKYLAQLLRANIGWMAADAYAKTIYDTWLRRQLIDGGEGIANAAFGDEPGADVTKLVDNAVEAVLALGGKLEAADEKITAAYGELGEMMRDRTSAETAALMQKIGGVVEQHLAPLLLQLHGLAAAGIDVGFVWRDGRANDHPILIPNPHGKPVVTPMPLGGRPVVSAPRPFIHGAQMTLGDDTVELNVVWRDDPAALALFEKHRPLSGMKHRLEREIHRIKLAAQAEREAAERAARNAPREPWIQHDYAKKAETDVPPKSTVPSADTRTPPGGEQDGLVKVDLGLDRTESLTAAEMDALWLQASGGIPRPAPDAEFLELAARQSPNWVKRLIEHEARIAARKVSPGRRYVGSSALPG